MSDAEGPASLRGQFDQWRPDVERIWAGRRPSAREALPVLANLLEQLHRRIAATTHDRTDQLQQLHELLLASFSGTLLAIRSPLLPVPQRIDDQPPGPDLLPGRRQIEALARRMLQLPEVAPEHDPVAPAPAPVPPVVDWSALLDQVAGALGAADRLLATTRPAPPPATRPPWHTDRELMELFQDLLAAGRDQDGAYALRLIEALRKNLLLRHDVEAIEFDDDNEYAFRYAEHVDPADNGYVTVKPALVLNTGDGRVVVWGEARRPSAPAVEEEPLG